MHLWNLRSSKNTRRYRFKPAAETLEWRRMLAGHGEHPDPPIAFLGDIDGDGEVGFGDFLRLSQSFGTQVDAGHDGDLDGDGHVVFSDFLLLARNFGKRVPRNDGGNGHGQNDRPKPNRIPTSKGFSQSKGQFMSRINRDRLEGRPLPFDDIATNAQAVFTPVIQAGSASGTPADSPANRVDANDGSSEFGGVGSLEVTHPTLGTFVCSATVITSTQALTAAHCLDIDADGSADEGIDVTLHLNDGQDFSASIEAAQLNVHPGFQGFLGSDAHDDLAIIDLAEAVPAGTPTYQIRMQPLGNGERMELVGYGQSGDGDTGYTIDPSYSVKRSGANAADLFLAKQDVLEAPDTIYLFDFDGEITEGYLGSGTLGNDIETTVGGGDSGGPSFADVGDSKQIVGVNTFTFALEFSAAAGHFGSMGGGIVIAPYLDWISSIAPDAIASNNAPSFTPGEDISVAEDDGAQTVAWASEISAGANEAGQTVQFLINSNSNPQLFAELPAIAADGTLTFTPAANANGTAELSLQLVDDGGTEYGGVNTSASHTLTITVLPVNDAPSFSVGDDITVDQDAGDVVFANFAGQFDPGPNESEQSVAEYIVSNDNPQLFLAAPSLDNDGRLTFTPNPAKFGTVTVTAQVRDTGGTELDGVDLSPVQEFTIAIEEVFGEPTVLFEIPDAVRVNEDAGTQNMAGFATEIAPEVSGFVLETSNDALFESQPTIGRRGRLRFTPADNAFGEAVVMVKAIGADDSVVARDSFLIVINPVNDAPSFAIAGDVRVPVDSGGHRFDGFASDFDPGNEFESGQQPVAFEVRNDRNDLFAVQPIITPDGVLAFTVAEGLSGIANVAVQVQDDGGTANGGEDLSAVLEFQIHVQPEVSDGLDLLEIRQRIEVLLSTIEDEGLSDQLGDDLEDIFDKIDDDLRPSLNLVNALRNRISALVNSSRIEPELGEQLLAELQLLEASLQSANDESTDTEVDDALDVSDDDDALDSSGDDGDEDDGDGDQDDGDEGAGDD